MKRLYFIFFVVFVSTLQLASFGQSHLKVAYFDTDTVFQKYLLVDELREGLKKSKDSLEGIFNVRQAAFEEKVKYYKNNLINNIISPTQAQDEEIQLMNERDEIMKMNEEYTQYLVLKESGIQALITNNIIDYTKVFNKKFGADYILGYTRGGPIIVVNEKWDVTERIVEGLNKEYLNKKGN